MAARSAAAITPLLMIGIFLERYIVTFWRRTVVSDFPLVLFKSALT
jgi:hypothetical protein